MGRLIKRELRKAENLQDATRQGKAMTVFFGVLETCCSTGKTDEQNFSLEMSATLGSKDFKWIFVGDKLMHDGKKKEEWIRVRKICLKSVEI